MSALATVPALVARPAGMPAPYLFSVDQYHRMADIGIFRPDERLELIEGEIIHRMAERPRPDGSPPPTWPEARLFTVDEYHRMIAAGVLYSGEPVELIEGQLVQKMSRGTPHDGTLNKLLMLFVQRMPLGWQLRSQSAVTLRDNEPEPDLAIVRTDPDDYYHRHPGPADIGLLVEIADSSVLFDRTTKLRGYARNSVPVYWIVNVPQRRIEVYTEPSGPTSEPEFAHRDEYGPGEQVPLTLDGQTVGQIAVSDFIR